MCLALPEYEKGDRIRTRHLPAEHGVFCRFPNERFRYFGWRCVARAAELREKDLSVLGFNTPATSDFSLPP